MPTPTDMFDYDLPKNLIAQYPISPRELSCLMIVDKKTGTIMHKHISDLPGFFKSGDILVVNNTKVFKARLFGQITVQPGLTSKVEILLLKPKKFKCWQAIGQPGKKFLPGRFIDFHKNFSAEIISKNSDGSINLKFKDKPEEVIRKANKRGLVPVPPYIKNQPALSDYQTSYAKKTGSVAAPTAGFHLTPRIRDRLQKQGVNILEITLHVGLGTFLPIKTPNIEDHKIHSEWVEVTQETADAINCAKQNHQKIIAVGTTVVRTLEGIAELNSGWLNEYSGDINLYITPGFKFRIVDSLITNFHLPKSSLLVLVSAFAGRDLIMKAYRQAIIKKYRFYSFGDAMLIL